MTIYIYLNTESLIPLNVKSSTTITDVRELINEEVIKRELIKDSTGRPTYHLVYVGKNLTRHQRSLSDESIHHRSTIHMFWLDDGEFTLNLRLFSGANSVMFLPSGRETNVADLKKRRLRIPKESQSGLLWMFARA